MRTTSEIASSIASSTRGRTLLTRAAKPSGTSQAMPPMRMNEWMTRAPVTSSRISQIHSRALSIHNIGVKAPSSIASAPLQVRWSAMRANSPRITRRYWQRSVAVMPRSCSTASA